MTAAITSIPTHAWQPIQYPNAVFDEDEHRWVSDAEVAEVDFIAFTGRRKAEHVACRLVVRRVKRLQPLASGGSEQGELFATYRHHAFITNSTLSTLEADQRHRDHALVEQVIAELKDGPLAHLPSGRYTANAAWVALAVIAYNLTRATAVAAAMRTAPWATLRTRSSTSPPGSQPPADASSSTYRHTGHGQAAGSCCGRPRPAHPSPSRPNHQPATAQPRTEVETPGRPAAYWRPHQHSQRPQPESATRNHPLGGSGLSQRISPGHSAP